MIHEGQIDLNPSYQRDVVWPDSKQVGLIDSLFRNFYVPPVVFALTKDEDGAPIRVCVDGKQRLTSIQKFFDGQVLDRDPVTKRLFWFTISESSRGVRNEIPEKYKKEFANKSITCVEYYDIDPAQEREIFQRVQLGMTLTAAEKLQAISSPFAEWISELESRHVTVENGLSHVLEWDTKRGRDYQNLAHFIFCCDRLPAEDLPTPHKLEVWLSREDPPTESFKNDIEAVLTDFWNMATDRSLNEAFRVINKRIAPVEFVFIAVLLYQLRKYNKQARAKAIYNLRKSIREQFVDIRMNTKVMKVLWSIIHSLQVEPTAAVHVEEEKPLGRKRKRGDKASESDDEYRPDPVRQIGKPLKTRGKR
ncbi:hypothetical protein AGABI1DRAFT_38315 [Agaricus bisporus var. burnettii JB137-S8]|uniref:GmrSD restriction endonucleases N-terminal domain-containing protein n=1 Tax=Agaricus bisporus var. burnettii (strain JB137-S8 / ATCC MYA-4627 / FGSC 10392) TaxID=597362 RepID=K5XA64_AGABU|nr:uncharacterized protein AGABI1DRAFT_38315 [Agaricus bisporus var. burnettii JB137-S8]EKM80113.1 hypothetical protein AGABI1DRAFT_38315 [Agaricus bisporus var. burnettii JB137-S8]